MRRVRLIDAQTHLVWIRQQRSCKERFVARVEIGPQLLFLLFIGRAINRVLEFALEDCRRSHCSAPAVEGTPSGETEPRLVPEENQIGLDGQALLHHPLYVINMSVKSAVR